MFLGRPADVIDPNAGLPRFVFGLPSGGVFEILNASALNCSLVLSVMLNSR
jgi:hypothetical protein